MFEYDAVDGAAQAAQAAPEGAVGCAGTADKAGAPAAAEGAPRDKCMRGMVRLTCAELPTSHLEQCDRLWEAFLLGAQSVVKDSAGIEAAKSRHVCWNPYRKAVLDHSDWTVCQAETNRVRAALGLRVPWTPEIGKEEAGWYPVFAPESALQPSPVAPEAPGTRDGRGANAGSPEGLPDAALADGLLAELGAALVRAVVAQEAAYRERRRLTVELAKRLCPTLVDGTPGCVSFSVGGRGFAIWRDKRYTDADFDGLEAAGFGHLVRLEKRFDSRRVAGLSEEDAARVRGFLKVEVGALKLVRRGGGEPDYALDWDRTVDLPAALVQLRKPVKELKKPEPPAFPDAKALAVMYCVRLNPEASMNFIRRTMDADGMSNGTCVRRLAACVEHGLLTKEWVAGGTRYALTEAGLAVLHADCAAEGAP